VQTGITSLEQALLRHRVGPLLALIVVTVLCWAWIVPMARDMYGAMDGPSAWMMTRTWDAAHVFLLWAMWVVMMIGMMLPTVAPTLLLYASALRRSGAASPARKVYSLAGGYLFVWVLFSTAATLFQRLLTELLLLTPMMEMASPKAAGALLLVAGIYQFTPLKHECLRSCHSPLAVVAQHCRPGGSGAFRAGFKHGLHCLGCCWALMLLLFAGGVMNLYVIAAITALVLLEKVTPAGIRAAGLAGISLIGLGLWLLTK
jgi:predicted metal-binding membrane protein